MMTTLMKVAIAFAAAMSFGCSGKADFTPFFHIVDSNRKLTDVIITDIFTPPVASRIYAYANIAAYETIAQIKRDSIYSLAGQLRDLEISLNTDLDGVHEDIASFAAFISVGKKLVFNEHELQNYYDSVIQSLEKAYSKRMVENSVNFGEEIARQVLVWAGNDGYAERTGLPRFQPANNRSNWEPTPPDYMSAIEPNWNTVRPFVLDSVSQFMPVTPTKFDSTKNSQFYLEALVVYKAVNEIDSLKSLIANYWDCNPNISYRRGHLMLFKQKLSPGGHWISIAGIVAKQTGLSNAEAVRRITLTSIALADAFISCWDEKYRSNVIRPQTYINRYIDDSWKPILQTPAFPEYTSGHSVISSAAATVLTGLYGESFQFMDTSEVPFGLPARTYSSFYEASQEAAISRLYGGIHYFPAIENGVDQGKRIGDFIFKKLKTTK
jgi:hypothetical protein